jgi:WD40 repeat protein
MVVRLSDPSSGQLVRLFRGHARPVSGLAFSPNGQRLVSGDHEGTIRAWGTEGGSVELVVPGEDLHFSPIMAIAYSPDGLSFATAAGMSADSWDSTTGKRIRPLAKHDWALYCLAYSHDGRWIASGSRDGP